MSQLKEVSKVFLNSKKQSQNFHCIGISLSTSTCEETRRRKEPQILYQLALIVGSFLVGYIPMTGLNDLQYLLLGGRGWYLLTNKVFERLYR